MRPIILSSVSFLFVAVSVLLGTQDGFASDANAVGCPDYDVSFARGTGETPGVGSVGEAFIDALKSRVQGKGIDVYAVDYPAYLDPNLGQTGNGTNDLTDHIEHVAALCPSTKFVTGGYSQGAAVVDMLLSGNPLRDAYVRPLPQALDQKIAAVALFGNPANGQLRPGDLDLSIRNGLGPKVIDLCNPRDIACDPAGGNLDSHVTYGTDGSAQRAAQFAAHQLLSPDGYQHTRI
ncbi:cutinase family protein [Mycobacteroides abscessus]|uniref:cutinase family protein n=1 Tax=Mycobacteroides abscessus TaxID=36809 RepID=UPI000C25EF64|nr:cutinase family protein [Mycobacteroides abscessus]